MKESISPGMIFNGVLNGDLSKNIARDQLLLLLEGSDNPKIRTESIETINKLKIRDPRIFKVLENSLLSDENSFVRNSAAKLICKLYLTKGLSSLIWTLQHEKSPLVLKTIGEYSNHLKNRNYTELKQEIDKILLIISNIVGVIQQEAKFILDLEAIFAQKKDQYELELKSYQLFKNLMDHKLKEFWLTIRNSHIETLSYNYFSWNFIKENPKKFNSISKLNDPNIFFDHLRNLHHDDHMHIILPNSLNSLSCLKKLNLRHNYIRLLPESLFELESLQVLDLSHNQIKKIPISIIKLKNLDSFKVHDNIISYFSNPVKLYLDTLKTFKF